MAAPWQETPLKVVVEFQKSNEGASRVVKLKHNAAVVPQQLAGRLNPAAWQAFMAEVEQAAQQHPYVVSPSAGRMCGWVGAAVLGCVLGICCVNPDGGDYSTWLNQVQSIIDRHRGAFAAAGAEMSLQRAQRSYWIQIDIVQALGMPVYQQQQQPQQQPPVDYAAAKPGYQA